MCEIIYDEGIHIKDTDLWFDAKKPVKLSFISNANVSSFDSHERIISTPETIDLIGNKANGLNVLACPYNRPFNLGKLIIELLPSGYALGSSQIVVDSEGTRIVYTGDLKLRYSATSKYIEMRRCDKLIMKCRYALPKFLFPSDTEILEKIYDFVKESLFFKYTPIIFIESLGKVQDLVQFLGEKKVHCSLHQEIFRKVKIYEKYGYSFINYEGFSTKDIKGKVLIFSINMRKSAYIKSIAKKRTCIVMGLAIENENIIKSVFDVDVDVAFPLSNHAGYDELIQYIEIVKPKEILLLEGSCIEFSNKLNSMGYNAKPVENPVQLKLF